MEKHEGKWEGHRAGISRRPQVRREGGVSSSRWEGDHCNRQAALRRGRTKAEMRRRRTSRGNDKLLGTVKWKWHADPGL